MDDVLNISEPDFYGDLVYVMNLRKLLALKKIQRSLLKTISHYKKIDYNINDLQQTACLVVNPITVGNLAFLFNCRPGSQTSDGSEL